MLLTAFFPGELRDHPETGVQELLRALLIRTNFVPVVRHLVGWRGLKQSVAEGECWTARIQGAAGVYGPRRYRRQQLVMVAGLVAGLAVIALFIL